MVMAKHSVAIYNKEIIEKVHTFYHDVLKIDFSSDNLNYYIQSLTLTSYAKEYNDISKTKINDNRGLATLGDAVLDACISKLAFLANPYISRGKVTDCKKHYGRNENLNRIGKEYLKLNNYLLKKSSDNTLKKAHATAVEAIIGCIFLNKGFDQAFAFVNEYIIMNTETFDFN